MSYNFCSAAEAHMKAGANVNTDIIASVTALATYNDEAEMSINAITKTDWIANPPTTNFAGILKDTASSMMAMNLICYDMSGYTDRAEATTMLDVLRDNVERNLGALKEASKRDKM